MDKFFKADKLICQIESLKYIQDDDDCGLDDYMFDFSEELSCSDEEELPSYDLVIIDEIESVLAHFKSPTVTDKEDTFDLLSAICANSNKILALDGDYHNRSYDFISGFGPNIVLENTIKKDKSHYIFTNNLPNFEKELEQDLVNGKNIVLISMSSTLAEKYENKLKDRFKCKLHCSKSNDEDKKFLVDVEKYWNNFQIVIYSPFIEAGIDFNIPHFYKKYVILSSNSCSQRALCQMIGRVRQTENNVIKVFLNGLPFKEKANFYTYEEIKQYVFEMHRKYLTPQIIKNDKTGKYIKRYNSKQYTQLIIHNELEAKNKTSYYFVPLFLQMIKDKGCTYELCSDELEDNTTKNKKKVDTIDFHKGDILEAEDINYDKYEEYIKNQQKNIATTDQKLAIEKYLYKRYFKVKDVNEEFLNKYFRKIHVLHNIRLLFGKKNLEVYDGFDQFEIKRIDFESAKKQEQIDMIKEVIDNIGFDLDNMNIKVPRNVFQEAVNKCLKECTLFVDPQKSQPLFGFYKRKIDSIKSFLGFMNSLLKDWGLKIENKVKFSNIKVNNKWKSIKIIKYYMNYHNNISNFI
jgi:hypothetical protein